MVACQPRFPTVAVPEGACDCARILSSSGKRRLPSGIPATESREVKGENTNEPAIHP